MWIEWKPEDGEHRHLFDDLGFDSLDGFDFVVRLEETFELHADEDDFGRTFTVKSVIAAVCRLLEADGRLIGG